MQLTDTILLVFVLCSAAIWGTLGTVLLVRKPAVAFDIVLIALVANSISIHGLSVSLGPFSVYLEDAVFSLLALGFVCRAFRSRGIRIPQVLLIILLLVFFYTFLRGLAEFGPFRSTVEARSTFYFLSCAAFFSTVPISVSIFQRLIDRWLFYSSCLFGLAMFRWIAEALGLGIADTWRFMSESASSDAGLLRVLPSSEALFILGGFLISLQLLVMGIEKPFLKSMCVAFGMTVLLLQHRSVWVAGMGAIAYIALHLYGQRGAVARRRLIRVGMVAIVGASAWLVLGAGQLATALTQSGTNTGTFEYRLLGWQSLLAERQDWTLIDRVLGAPFGSSFVWYFEGNKVEISPHNYYIQTLLRLGVAGLVVVLSLYMLVLHAVKRESRQMSSNLYPHPALWGGLIISQLIYFVPYAPSPDQAIVLGCLLALAGARASGASVSQS